MPLPPMVWAEYLARRRRRLDLAARADQPEARAELLTGWSFSGYADLVERLTLPGAPPPVQEMEKIVAWALQEPPEPQAKGGWTETTLDLHGLSHLGSYSCSSREREMAAWVLLGRLGDEVAVRERGVWQERKPIPDFRDGRARRQWEAMLAGTTKDLRIFTTLYRDTIRGAVETVLAARLQMPPAVVRRHADEAMDAIELLPWDGYLDLASRVVEATSEPIAAMSPYLGADGEETVLTCVRSREAWREVWELYGRPTDLRSLLGPGLDLHIARRLMTRLAQGKARARGGDLPEWDVVRQNRSRARGRLRAVLKRAPASLKAAILALPEQGLFQRTAAALRALVVEWIWRSARVGLSFDVGSYKSPACEIEPEDVPLIRVLDDEAAIRTTLLHAIARGHWADLVCWLDGGTPRRTLYRVLEALEHRISDAALGLGGERGYRAFREALDGRLDEWNPGLRVVAWRVAAVPDGPDPAMRVGLHQALSPEWDESACRMPVRFLRRVKAEFAAFVAAESGVG